MRTDAPVLTAEAQRAQRKDQRKEAVRPALSRLSAWTAPRSRLRRNFFRSLCGGGESLLKLSSNISPPSQKSFGIAIAGNGDQLQRRREHSAA